MIINNKVFPLTNKYKIKDNNLKFLKVKLLILNNNKINMQQMFYGCKCLKEFHVITQEETELKEEFNEEHKKKKFEHKIGNDSNESTNKLFNQFYNINKKSNSQTKINIIKNENKLQNHKKKLNLIYIFNKDIISGPDL